jgi:hypothetical protein
MIFIASVEVEPLPGSKMTGDRIGALVYCLIPAESKKDAKQRLHEVLKSDKYRLVRTEFLDEYRNFRWENNEDKVAYDKLARRALLSNDVVYGPFYSWKTN